MPQPASNSSKPAAWYQPGGSIISREGDKYDEGYHKSVYPDPDTRVMLSNVDLLSLIVVFSLPRTYRCVSCYAMAFWRSTHRQKFCCALPLVYIMYTHGLF